MGLSELTWPEVGELRRPTLAVPLGSVEQHGPHLPLDTDTRVASALVDRLASARGEVVAGPPLAYGASGEHAAFPGTLSIGAAALELVVLELIRSADHFAGVVLVNGHGGNHHAVRAAAATARAEGRAVLVWEPHVPGGDAHAGRVETSLLLAIDPSCVTMALAEPGATAPLAELMPRLVEGGVAAVSRSGVLGDPTTASAELGHSLLEQLVGDLVSSYDRWRSRR